MLSPGAEAEGGKPEYGILVGPGVNAQHHQHMFCARLDMAVDDPEGGAGCVVTEVRGATHASRASHSPRIITPEVVAAVERVCVCPAGPLLPAPQVNVEALPFDEATNPYGNAFRAVETVLDSVHKVRGAWLLGPRLVLLPVPARVSVIRSSRCRARSRVPRLLRCLAPGRRPSAPSRLRRGACGRWSTRPSSTP